LGDLSEFIFTGGVQIDSGAAKRFIRSSLWEAKEEGSPARNKLGGREEGEGSRQGNARKRRKVDPGNEHK
jgi:hypothetical protein